VATRNRETDLVTVDRPLAVVTGATAGIGAAFAHRLAAEGYRLVLVARDGTRLAATADALGGADVVAVDLSTEAGCAEVERRLRAEPVDLLVNNAGTSLNRTVLTSALADEERQLRLNVNAVLRLTLAVLPGMVQRGRGGIVNVSSVAGFAPAMPGSTYPASKAWVTNFSESVAHLVQPAGVRVTALCPGYTRVESREQSWIDTSRLPAAFGLEADYVVRIGLRDLRRGRAVSVPSWKYKAMAAVMRHLPPRLLQAASRSVRGRVGLAVPSDRRR
jgi:short-subunit dehydrogenase